MRMCVCPLFFFFFSSWWGLCLLAVHKYREYMLVCGRCMLFHVHTCGICLVYPRVVYLCTVGRHRPVASGSTRAYATRVTPFIPSFAPNPSSPLQAQMAGGSTVHPPTHFLCWGSHSSLSPCETASLSIRLHASSS
jgi:hypothetical protein